MEEHEQLDGLAALEKVNTALQQCRAAGRRPVCILCRPAFYRTLKDEADNLSTAAVSIGVHDLGGAKTVFGVRLAVTDDVADDVNAFEVLV